MNSLCKLNRLEMTRKALKSFSKTEISLAKRIKDLPTTSIWGYFTQLAIDTSSINLGQGFPNWDPPDFLIDCFVKNLQKSGIHQYTRSYGHPVIVQQISKKFSPLFQRDIDPMKEILIVPGAQSSLFYIFQALVNEGDEVVCFQPGFQQYYLNIITAQGRIVGQNLTPQIKLKSKQALNIERKQNYSYCPNLDSWNLNLTSLRNALNSRTKILILNSPQNPTGKIFTQEELVQISYILEDFPNVVVISDEVYEHIFLDHNISHIPKFATLPRMFEKTLTISSAGKTFSSTGFKFGWVIGPKKLIEATHHIHHQSQFCQYVPQHLAMAEALDIAEQVEYKGEKNYYDWIRKRFLENRDVLIRGLAESSLDFYYWVPQGGYFGVADISDIDFDEEYLFDKTNGRKYRRDFGFCQYMAHKKGVVAIPLSEFYSGEDPPENYVRFAICKDSEQLSEAMKRLK